MKPGLDLSPRLRSLLFLDTDPGNRKIQRSLYEDREANDRWDLRDNARSTNKPPTLLSVLLASDSHCMYLKLSRIICSYSLLPATSLPSTFPVRTSLASAYRFPDYHWELTYHGQASLVNFLPLFSKFAVNGQVSMARACTLYFVLVRAAAGEHQQIMIVAVAKGAPYVALHSATDCYRGHSAAVALCSTT
jgi:hypothetical protein